MKTRYTKEQSNALVQIQRITQQFFTSSTSKPQVKAHDYRHAKRVAEYAKYIGEKESVRNVFLCEIAGLVHDIGRVPEALGSKPGLRHHEWSYELLREWFRIHTVFNTFTKAEKIELLYAVRYHWNDEANKYDTAWILRDADKLEMFGTRGLKRSQAFFVHDPAGLGNDIRLRFYVFTTFRTKTAQEIMKKKNLFEPIKRWNKKYLRDAIGPITV